jgi:hypothetical protein
MMRSVAGAAATGLLSWQTRSWRGLRPGRYRSRYRLRHLYEPQIKTLPVNQNAGLINSPCAMLAFQVSRVISN